MSIRSYRNHLSEDWSFLFRQLFLFGYSGIITSTCSSLFASWSHWGSTGWSCCCNFGNFLLPPKTTYHLSNNCKHVIILKLPLVFKMISKVVVNLKIARPVGVYLFIELIWGANVCSRVARLYLENNSGGLTEYLA